MPSSPYCLFPSLLHKSNLKRLKNSLSTEFSVCRQLKTDSNHSEMQSREESSNSSYSPSFNSYFNSKLTQIAARVSDEVIDEDSEYIPPEASSFRLDDDEYHHRLAADEFDAGEEDNDGEEFEFNLTSLISLNGDDIGPVYPVFDRSLLNDLESYNNTKAEEKGKSRVQIQLKNLFLHEQAHEPEPPSSSSSSEADELEALPPETYCEWTPQSPSRCTKSNSTGSASTSRSSAAAGRAWRLRNLLRRSKSDGKEGLVLMAPKNRKKEVEEKGGGGGGGGGEMKKMKEKLAKSGKGRPAGLSASRRGYYGNRNNIINMEGGEFNRRKSYLPYRQDLVGFFATPRAMRKMNFPPF